MAKVTDILLDKNPPRIFVWVEPTYDEESDIFLGRYNFRIALFKPLIFSITDEKFNPYIKIDLSNDSNRKFIKSFLTEIINDGFCRIITFYTVSTTTCGFDEEEIHITEGFEQVVNLGNEELSGILDKIKEFEELSERK